MKQKLLLIALTLLMPVTAFAWYNGPDGFYDFEVDSIYYEIVSEAPPKVRVCSSYWRSDDSGSLIEYSSNDYSGNLVIPDDVTCEGITYAVTDICWNAFLGCSDLESISVPASITNITITGYWMGAQEGVSPNGTNGLKSIKVAEGNPVFDSRNDCNAIIETSSNKLIAGCDNTIIPNTVTAIGTSAFVNCYGLTNVILPSSITEIGQSAYACCYYLNTIEIPCSVSYIGPCAFLRSGLTEFIWPDSTHIISNGVFNESSIRNIKIPNTVTTIESCSFFGSDLSNITIPNSVTTIDSYAFANCIFLAEVNSMATVPPSIGSNTFDYYRTTLYVPQESCDAYRNANGWRQFHRILPIRDIVELNGLYYTFTSDSTACVVFNNENCYSGDVVIPESVSYNGKEYAVDAIDQNAFYGCRELTSIEIPNTVKTIGDYAFCYCNGLTRIEIPNSVITIGEQAFFECSRLESVIIGNSVTSIGNYAFYYCSNLVEVNCLALNPPSISLYTFNCYDRATLIVPRKRVESYRQDNYWRRFSTILPSSSAIEVNGICYDYTSDNTVCVTYKDESYNSYSGDIVIPESVSYNGKDYIVNAIDEKAFYNCSGLTSVIIPNTITIIGNNAFNGCSALTGIDIPNSIFIIGDYAFRNCTGLLNVNIPDSLSTIGAYSFYGCSGLTSLTIGKSIASIGNNAFNSCNNLKELTWNAINCTSNGNMSTSNIEHVTIGPEVEVLPYYFVSGSKITEVSIPNSVTAINGEAFSYCSNLTSIEIPNSVTLIGSSVFQNCSSLTNIELPNSITNIYRMTFYGCSELKSINIPDSVKTIGVHAFNNCSSLMRVNIPSSVVAIGGNAFINCNALSKVIISNLTSWNNIIFEDATANPLYYSHHLYMNGQEIKQLVIPEGVTSIGNYAFVNGTSFLELTLPTTLESIGNYAFVGCKRLTNVSMGLSVTTIGSGAFKDCTAISSVTCMASTPPTMAGVDCFDSDCYDWATLYVPGDKVDEYKSTIYWNKFANTFGTGIEVDGLFYLFDLDKGEATVTYKDETYYSYRGEVIIPETVNYGGLEYTVTGIGKAAFAYCDELMSVTIPHTVTSIGDYAFMYCEGLTSITIPDSVKSIGDNSFDGCGALCAVEIPNSVISIGNMAFQGCTSLTDITIGSGVTNIGAKAFNYCNSLHSVTCIGSVPPLMDNSDCFTSYGYTATLKVPQTSIEDYQSSNYWYKFAVIEGFNLSEPGDVNGDGGINISDVTALIDLLLSGGEISAGADVNGDGQVNISDVTALIDRLLSGN